MNSPFFLISLFSITFLLQLIRLPYLVLENGGGAFLILFFLVLHLFCFPLLVAEKTLDTKLKKMDFLSLIFIKKNSRIIWLDSFLVLTWMSLRLIVIGLLLCFFLNLGLNAIFYSLHFFKYYLGLTVNIIDQVEYPKMELSLLASIVWSSLVFIIFFKIKKKFFDFSVHFVLPTVLFLFLILFFKSILSVSDFSGLKTLLYPDFSALNSQSLISLIGHGLACLFIGIGFYDHSLLKKVKNDPIDVFIQAIIQTLILSFFVGLMALPLIEQVGEVPYGSSFIFEILPRWLSYGEYGQYYSLLYFLSLSYMGLYLSVLLTHLLSKNIVLLSQRKKRLSFKYLSIVLFVIISAGSVVLLQNKMLGWQGQSFLLKMDSLVFHYLMPILALLMLWFVFRYTNSKERAEVFSQQQVFFHNRVFFRVWQCLSLYFVPFFILLAWILSSFK